MQYMGGKARIAKNLARVMLESTKERGVYLEPFLGGCHVLPLMASHFDLAIASDVMPDVAMLWRDALAGWQPPVEVSRELYAQLRHAEPSALRAFVGFGCSFGGKWFGGYASNARGDDFISAATRGVARKIAALDPAKTVIREQDYRDHEPAPSTIVYCDPPYASTTAYAGAPPWDASEFWKVVETWSRNGALVFVSEYAAPTGWTSIWTKTAAVGSLKKDGNAASITEHLFVHESTLAKLVDKPNDTSIGFGAMTTSTSADVKEIQDRNAAARGRVLSAPYGAVETENIPDVQYTARIIEAAIMELAAVWREEAAHVTAAKRKGHVSIAKEYTQAAARLAGFAVGLTTRPITNAERVSAMADTWDNALAATEVHPPQCDCGRPECAALELAAMDALREACSHPHAASSTRKDGSTLCTACGAVITLNEMDRFADVLAALPEGDPVVAVFTSPAVEAERQELLSDLAVKMDILPGTFPLADYVTTSEEQNLRDIIGPLGAGSVTATIDHPFTNPGVPWLNKTRAVEVIPYAQLPVIAAATPPRDHVSHSYVETYEGCSLSAMLRDASRAGHIGASRPGWSMIGGNAFHGAVEMIERAALSGVTLALATDDIEALWGQCFDTEIKERLAELAGTPYADSSTWYISNRGKEGFDWWRVEGAKMLGLYVKHHTSEWRAAHQTFLLQDKTPVIELPYTMSIRSLDGERGLTAQGFVDRATLDMSSYSLTVLDYKTGARDPESTFQLGEYGHALLMAMGIPDEPPDRPILGQYWLARKGIYTDAVPVVTRHPLAELQYRYDAADRGQRARIFSPHVTNLCKSCSVVDYCPTQAGRS